MSREKIGTFGVDAGCVWIGDPCYCVTPDANSHPAKTWAEFCDLAAEKGLFKNGFAQFDSGVVSSTGYGDGEYPVYAERNKEGRICKIIIDFEPKEEEDDQD